MGLLGVGGVAVEEHLEEIDALVLIVRAELVGRNAVDGLILPGAERKEMTIVTPDELHRLADAAGDTWATMIFAMGYSGLRIGEADAMTWDRVDLDQGRLEVTGTVTEAQGRLRVDEPKTRAGRRAIPMPEFLRAVLALRVGGRTEPIWPDTRGGFVRPNNWRRRVWHSAATRVDLAGMTPHQLRHTAVSYWIAAGADLKSIQVWAGHQSVTTVIDLYGHLLDTSGGVVFEQLDSLARAAAMSGDPRKARAAS